MDCERVLARRKAKRGTIKAQLRPWLWSAAESFRETPLSALCMQDFFHSPNDGGGKCLVPFIDNDPLRDRGSHH
ncbi:hypothetical protein CEXT_116331 [Caerostris extrusa]|uniref:Uncharacterized protein n=1 Tax=Caerostris extrusa TaxID=172846 RepID=A0AAV4WUG7_CAEEX|nr:hypothetical protein CEXT_116331 [Caerostris extrusa]